MMRSGGGGDFLSIFLQGPKRALHTAGLMARVISMMLLRGKEDQFAIKMVWLVLQLTSVGEDSKCGHCVQDFFFLFDTDEKIPVSPDEK